MHWLYPLHSGSAFGEAGKIAMFMTGFAMLLMFPTGVWVWLRKKRAAAFEATRRIRLRSKLPTQPRTRSLSQNSAEALESRNGAFE